MNEQIFQKRISAIRDILRKIDCILTAMATLDAERFPHEHFAMCTEAALLAEQAACMTRNILYATSGCSRQKYLSRAATAHGIQICYTDRILEIALPCLLPHKQGRYSSVFVFDPLNAALENFTKAISIPRYRECTVCICHVFEGKLTDNCFFDYDNLQQKQLLDTVAAHVLTDDNALLCDVYQTAEYGESDQTRIYVMPKNCFPQWLSWRQKHP